jgi:hypothetical protein
MYQPGKIVLKLQVFGEHVIRCRDENWPPSQQLLGVCMYVVYTFHVHKARKALRVVAADFVDFIAKSLELLWIAQCGHDEGVKNLASGVTAGFNELHGHIHSFLVIAGKLCVGVQEAISRKGLRSYALLNLLLHRAPPRQTDIIVELPNIFPIRAPNLQEFR